MTHKIKYLLQRLLDAALAVFVVMLLAFIFGKVYSVGFWTAGYIYVFALLLCMDVMSWIVNKLSGGRYEPRP